MRFYKGGLSYGTATHVEGITLRQRVKDAVIKYKRSRRYAAVFLTHMEPVRKGTITLQGIVDA